MSPLSSLSSPRLIPLSASQELSLRRGSFCHGVDLSLVRLIYTIADGLGDSPLRTARIPHSFLLPVVLTTKGVSEWKRARLRKDGAVVIIVDDVPLPDWFSIDNPKWIDVITKLRVFQQIQYKKILLFDVDVLSIRRLDGVF